jgi:hypothetical protein
VWDVGLIDKEDDGKEGRHEQVGTCGIGVTWIWNGNRTVGRGRGVIICVSRIGVNRHWPSLRNLQNLNADIRSTIILR